MAWNRVWAGAEAPVNPAASTLEFTPQERAWIAAHPVIRVGHDPTYAPYSFPDGKGNIIGIDLDFLALIAKRTGQQFKNEVRRDWSAMLAAFKAHEVDVLGSVALSLERESYMAYSNSYTLAPNVIITRNDSPYFFDLRDLAGRAISVPRGYAGLRNDLNELAPGHKVVEYDDSLACYEAVARGEVFASIGDVANASYLIKQHRLSNLRLGSVITASSEIFFGIRKDWPELASIMNKAIADFTPLERKAINDRWIAIDIRQDRWWVVAFRIAAGIAAAAVFVFLLLFLRNRRLASELEQRRLIQTELEETRDRLARVNEEKSEWLRMVAHDLRNPLTGILLGTDLLKMMDPAEGKKIYDETLDQIRTTTAQMIRLTNDLVDVNVLEDGRRPYASVETDLDSVLHETVSALSEAAALKRIRLSVKMETAVPTIRSDAVALRQVCENLLSNALKYSPPNSDVVVNLCRAGDGVRMSVQDHGPGISAAEGEKLFQKFVQGAAKPTGGEKSTGLGLWIARRIVTDLHGRVWCESELGKGATFIVELPIAPPAAD